MPRFTCTPVSPKIARRSVIAAFGALALAPITVRAGSPLRINDLVDNTGLASERARALVGRSVALRGYLGLAPVGSSSLLLTELPSGPCQLCGAIHDAPSGVLVDPAGALPNIAALQVVEVTGQLELGARGEVRLVSAQILA